MWENLVGKYSKNFNDMIAFYVTTDLTNLKCLALGGLNGVEMPGLSLNQFCCNGKGWGKQPPNRSIKSSKKFIFTCYTSNFYRRWDLVSLILLF